MSSEFSNWLTSRGIVHQTSVPKSPQQNGTAERSNRTVLELSRSVLQSSNLGSFLWTEAANCAVYLLNRTVSSRNRNTTPYELWHGSKPDCSHLKNFGSTAYVYVPKDERSKLEPKSIKCFYVGYSEVQKGYRFWDPAAKHIRISTDATFTEDHENHCSVQPCVTVTGEGGRVESLEERAAESISETQADDLTEADEEKTPANESKEQRPTRQVRKPKQWIEESETYLSTSDDPCSLSQVLVSPERKEWETAMKEEMESLLKHSTWTLEPLPPGQRAVKCKWLFKKKLDSLGNVQRFKARLVARGFTQQEGIDYSETFSPVVRYESLRVILSIAASENMEIYQINVKTAFLHGELEETIYMHQPPGFIKKDREDYVCRLRRSLYGLKQASRAWNSKLNSILGEFGMTATSADPCVYVSAREKPHGSIILAVWVDDGL